METVIHFEVPIVMHIEERMSCGSRFTSSALCRKVILPPNLKLFIDESGGVTIRVEGGDK